MKKLIFTFFLYFCAAVFIFAGGASESKADEHADQGGRLQVVATTSIITDVVRNIAGDKADVAGLIPLGQNVHGYVPKPRQMVMIEDAHLIFVNGLNLEEQMLELVYSNSEAPVVEVSEGIDVINEDEDEHQEGEHEEGEEHHHAEGDPHTWMSLRNAEVWVRNIAEALTEADPSNGSYYNENAEAYLKEIRELDNEIASAVDDIPVNRRMIISDHAVFNYFARDYGFEVSGTILPSFSTNSEASAKHLGELVDIINRKDIKAIFVGASAGEDLTKLAEALSEESGTDINIITILTGSLAPEGSPGDTYLGYFRYNAEKIVKGLSTE